MFFDAQAHDAFGQAELAGSCGHVAVVEFQGVEDHFAFDPVESGLQG